MANPRVVLITGDAHIQRQHLDTGILSAFQHSGLTDRGRFSQNAHDEPPPSWSTSDDSV